MRVLFLTADSNGGYPVPAVNGGAVSTLIESMVEQNSKEKIAELTIVSYYTPAAFEASKKYGNASFCFVKIPRLVKLMDKLLFSVMSAFKKKAISYKSVFSLLYYIAYTASFLRNNDSFDKVVLENNIPLAMTIRFSKYKGEYYYHFHNVPRIDAKCRKVFENCSKYLCVSNYVANEISSPTSAIGPQDKKKVSVVYNCIDTEKFRKIEDEEKKLYYKKKFGIGKKEKVILFAGRLSQEKGVDILLDSLQYLKNQEYKVLIVGSVIHNASYVDEYQKKILASSQKYGNRVVFTGYIDQADIPHLYNLADVAVLPSMWEEPAGLTMIEALACGTPVITTQSGGIPEYVGNCAVVLSIDEKLSKNIASSIDSVFETPPNGEDGIERVNTYFNRRDYLKNFLDSLC